MKSTQSCTPAKRKDKRTRFLAMLGGLLLIFPLLLPATALAAPRSVAAPPLTRPQQVVDLAGVSVVRLVLSYHPVGRSNAVICTTLGTIIASWPAQNASDKNNWVLTDGSLLNVSSTRNTCAPGEQLGSIRIFASNGYTNNQPASAQLDLLTCSSVAVCSDTPTGTSGPVESILNPVNTAVLFSFHSSNPLPYVDVERAVTTTGNPAPTSIELVNSTTAIPSSAKNVDATTLEQFLTPISTSANVTAPGSAPTTPGTARAQTTEPGMPYIDGYGKMTGAQLFTTNSLVTRTDIENLEGQIALPQGTTFSQLLNSNTLSRQWDMGMIQYEQGNNQAAIQTLSTLPDIPPTFQAPAAFILKAQQNLSTTHNTPTSTTNNGQGNQGAFSSISSFWLLVIVIAAALVLILLFLLISIRFGRKRAERKRELARFEADVNSARQGVEGKERQVPVPQPSSPPSYEEPLNYPPVVAAPPVPKPAMPDSRCPNCGVPVEERAAFCPNCSYPLKLAGAESRRYPLPPAALAPTSADTPPIVQPQQPAQVPKMQDDPAIQAALQRLWDKAGR